MTRYTLITFLLMSVIYVDQSHACRRSALQTSKSLIDAIFKDLMKTYHVSGGGVSRIEQLSTLTYKVSLPQEERIDEITYEMGIEANCDILIKKRTMNTVTVGKAR